jgi:hypothetical protein
VPIVINRLCKALCMALSCSPCNSATTKGLVLGGEVWRDGRVIRGLRLSTIVTAFVSWRGMGESESVGNMHAWSLVNVIDRKGERAVSSRQTKILHCISPLHKGGQVQVASMRGEAGGGQKQETTRRDRCRACT